MGGGKKRAGPPAVNGGGGGGVMFDEVKEGRGNNVPYSVLLKELNQAKKQLQQLYNLVSNCIYFFFFQYFCTEASSSGRYFQAEIIMH